MSVQKLLFVEDEDEIRESVALMLRQEGYDVICAENGVDALIELSPDVSLVILDVMMPGMSGYEVCRHIRKKSKVPILFLTAKSEEEDVIRGFEEGADDYLAKPFSGRELIMRVRAILRRTALDSDANKAVDAPDTRIDLHRITLDLSHHTVSKNGRSISITETEYQILLLFMRNPGQVFSTRELYEQVWKEPFLRSSSNTVMVHIRRLRQKLENDPQIPAIIVTSWGRGYYFAS